ncbi:hypothetical protein [Flammeovirga sp. SJP92]|uniref:hypothetical protein n=1 Tax=Flammeovirga sp. SJP92 TaxID=1775430 RepID=UPI000788F0DD|nr:hypothetical protein [Flammeovirga sp. SJP92]KXX67607.1 hypothetical protein AVL50_26465 [Flammeovirga sp. SJP92]
MKSITFLATTFIIGILSFNAYFIDSNIDQFQKPIENSINDVAYVEITNQPRLQGVNVNLTETIIGAQGEFDNLFLRVQSDDYLKILDIKCNKKVVRAAFDGETSENISLVGLYFPIDHSKSVILNLKKIINSQLVEKGDYTIEIIMSNQNDDNGNPLIQNKEIHIKVV